MSALAKIQRELLVKFQEHRAFHREVYDNAAGLLSVQGGQIDPSHYLRGFFCRLSKETRHKDARHLRQLDDSRRLRNANHGTYRPRRRPQPSYPYVTKFQLLAQNLISHFGTIRAEHLRLARRGLFTSRMGASGHSEGQGGPDAQQRGGYAGRFAPDADGNFSQSHCSISRLATCPMGSKVSMSE